MLVDLSVALNESTPVYPGDPATQIRPAGVLASSGYQDHFISLGTHVGTHMDAPSHMLEGGKNLDAYPLERFRGRCVYVKGIVSLDELRKIDIRKADMVLFHTGMSYSNPDYFTSYPAMSEDVAHYLVERNVSVVGVDTCSVDNVEGFPIHKLLLAGDVLIIENLTNLEALAGKKAIIYAFPIKFELDGAPVRVVADLLS